MAWFACPRFLYQLYVFCFVFYTLNTGISLMICV